MSDIIGAILAGSGGILSAVAMYHIGWRAGKDWGRLDLYIDLDALTDEQIVKLVRAVAEHMREKGITSE